jgi:hypothetical protein
MRGAGVAGGDGGAAGRAATGGAGGAADAVTTGAAGAAGATTAGGGGGTGRGAAAGGATAGVGATTGFSFSTGGATTTGLTGGATGGVNGAAGGGTGFATGGATTGLATTGGGAGRAGGGATCSFCCVIALSTSPGREICERSILVLISSSPRSGRAVFAAADGASDEPRRCTRTFSASCSSSELECVFFSVTPTIGSTSRMALLLTSSSLARSLIRTLLIRPFLFPALCLGLHRSLTEFHFPHSRALRTRRERHDYSFVSGAEPSAGCATPS